MSDLKTINCTQCGAGLSVLGGGRVQAQVCGYCGAVLDAQENYALLDQYENMDRPDSPFHIGMTGRMKGVEFTIIGTLGNEMQEDGETYSWVDHQIYSPTHGYCWLTWTADERKVTFTRRVRGLADRSDRRRIGMLGRRFEITERYTSRLTFCEGEFTWPPVVGEETDVTEAEADGYVLAVTRSHSGSDQAEIEYTLTEDFDALATIHAFGGEVPDWASRYTFASTARSSLDTRGTGLFGMLVPGAALALVMSILAIIGLYAMQSDLAVQAFTDTPGPHAMTFEVVSTDRVHGIELHTPVSNTWAYYDISLTQIADDDAEIELAEIGREIGYYFGGSGDDSWSEGSQYTTIGFRPPATGEYALEIVRSEQGGGDTPLTVRVFYGQFTIIWLLMIAIASGIILVMRIFFR